MGEGEAGDRMILADFLAFAKLAVKNKVAGWMMRRGSDGSTADSMGVLRDVALATPVLVIEGEG